MKKELLIIVYKISIAGYTKQQGIEIISSIIDNYSLKNDEELKENYIIREIFLPLYDGGGETNVEVIYPKPIYNISPTIDDLVTEISNKIEEDPNNQFKSQWNKLVRELKIRKLNLEYE